MVVEKPGQLGRLALPELVPLELPEAAAGVALHSEAVGSLNCCSKGEAVLRDSSLIPMPDSDLSELTHKQTRACTHSVERIVL